MASFDVLTCRLVAPGATTLCKYREKMFPGSHLLPGCYDLHHFSILAEVSEHLTKIFQQLRREREDTGIRYQGMGSQIKTKLVEEDYCVYPAT